MGKKKGKGQGQQPKGPAGDASSTGSEQPSRPQQGPSQPRPQQQPHQEHQPGPSGDSRPAGLEKQFQQMQFPAMPGGPTGQQPHQQQGHGGRQQPQHGGAPGQSQRGRGGGREGGQPPQQQFSPTEGLQQGGQQQGGRGQYQQGRGRGRGGGQPQQQQFSPTEGSQQGGQQQGGRGQYQQGRGGGRGGGQPQQQQFSPTEGPQHGGQQQGGHGQYQQGRGGGRGGGQPQQQQFSPTEGPQHGGQQQGGHGQYQQGRGRGRGSGQPQQQQFSLTEAPQQGGGRGGPPAPQRGPWGERGRGQSPQQGAGQQQWGGRSAPPGFSQQERRGQRPERQFSPPAPQQQFSPPASQQQFSPPASQQGSQKPQQAPGVGRGGVQSPQQGRPPAPSQTQSPKKSAGDYRSPDKDVGPPTTGSGDRLTNMQLAIPGKLGRKITVESNHFTLNLGKLTSAVHYDVAITPDTPENMLRDVMNLFQQKHYPKRFPAFDGRKNLYATSELPFGQTISDNITVAGDGRPREFKVDIQYARTVDLTPFRDLTRFKETPQSAIQVIDIVLRSAPSKTCISTGRSFFTKPSGIVDLGEGMEMYFGFYQSAIRGWKPLLNVDVSHKAFPKEMNVVDLLLELGSDFRNRMERRDLARPIADYLKEKLEKFMRTLKVTYEVRGQAATKKVYRVNGLGDSARNARFRLDNGTTSNVEDFFKQTKRVNLEFPTLPTLWVGSRMSESRILLPMEFCTVAAGQALQRKMTENQTAAMIKHSATNTERRKAKIMDSMSKARFNDDPCVREFGISVGSAFEKLDARVLNPPSLTYGNNRKFNVSRGVWRGDGIPFLKPGNVMTWTVAWADRTNPRTNHNDLMSQLARMIQTQGNQSGMNLPPATQPFTVIGGRQQLQDIHQFFQSKKDFGLIFVVVPNSGPQYAYVKQAAELRVGCLTQCIKAGTLMRRLNPQTVGNILLKVNSKLNGTNHCLTLNPNILRKPCMIMGADVTHPGPDSQDIPSVAAVTASYDPKAFRYNICWRLQPPKVEIISDLAAIVKEQLLFFYNLNNGQKPYTLVFFRDGVSEGQFEQVKNAEIRALRQACTELDKEYQPNITFVVVQKRHHTRLFPTNPRDSEDKNMNVPAGTCVDSEITHRYMQDFYLVSHASIQGVAKPTKYCTLWDDNDFTNDEIEELAFHLCHMFTRCNRSVSYPAPTYYAHLAAARAKVYIEHQRLDMNRLHAHQEQNKIQECIVKGQPMFFV